MPPNWRKKPIRVYKYNQTREKVLDIRIHTYVGQRIMIDRSYYYRSVSPNAETESFAVWSSLELY